MNSNICNGMTIRLDMDRWNSSSVSERLRIPEQYKNGLPFYVGRVGERIYPCVDSPQGYIDFGPNYDKVSPEWFVSAFDVELPSTIKYKDLPNEKVKNGSLVRLNVEAYERMDKNYRPAIPPKHATGKPFQVGIDRLDPWINGRGMLVFNDTYAVSPDLFVPVTMVDEGEVKTPETYTIIIEHGFSRGTLKVLDIDGVVSHEYLTAGLLVKLTEDEQFYPWSYGFGIDTVTVTKTED